MILKPKDVGQRSKKSSYRKLGLDYPVINIAFLSTVLFATITSCLGAHAKELDKYEIRKGKHWDFSITGFYYESKEIVHLNSLSLYLNISTWNKLYKEFLKIIICKFISPNPSKSKMTKPSFNLICRTNLHSWVKAQGRIMKITIIEWTPRGSAGTIK